MRIIQRLVAWATAAATGAIVLTLIEASVRGQCYGGVCYPSQPAAEWQPATGRGVRMVVPVEPSAPSVNFAQDAHCRIFVGDGSVGSGTLIARNDATGLVLTCSHLFDGTIADIVVAFPDGGRFGARLLERDRANDLAALLIQRPAADPASVSESEPDGVLVAVGYGGSGGFRSVRGAISGFARAVGATSPSVKIAGAVRPGDSGGGVLDTSGRLVGVVWGCRDGETYLTCGRPLRQFLDRVWPDRRAQGTGVGGQGTELSNVQPPAPNRDLVARIEKMESDVAALRTGKQDRGDYLQVGDLNGYAKRADIPAVDVSGLASRADLETLNEQSQHAIDQLEQRSASRIESLRTAFHSRIEQRIGELLPMVEQRIADWSPGLLGGMSYGKLVAGALGVSGPVAVAVMIAGGLAGRRLKGRVSRVKCRGPNNTSGPGFSTLDSRPVPIAVDSPPPPQQTVPETHYVPVEKDDFARAHQWASEQVARKYPGATEVLTTLESLIKQQLAAAK